MTNKKNSKIGNSKDGIEAQDVQNVEEAESVEVKSVKEIKKQETVIVDGDIKIKFTMDDNSVKFFGL